jgi:hypothetical protein
MNRILFCIALLAAVGYGCRKNIDNTIVSGPIPSENVEAFLSGQVLSSDGTILANATVEVAGLTLTTNPQGAFFVSKKTMDKNGTLVKVSKGGFFDAFRFVYPSLGATTTVTVTMQPKILTTSFSSTEVASITSGNTNVAIPANAIVRASGQAYSGQVNAYMVYYDPTTREGLGTMPGDLRAQDANGDAKILKSYGMFGLELESLDGEALQLSDGQKAKITMDIPQILVNNAPATIPLWHLDENNGYWIEEGATTLNNGRYEGEVTHFSFWNCDVPADFATISGRIKHNSGTYLSGVGISIKSGNFGIRNGQTNSDGSFRGLVPANESLDMNIYSSCNASLLSDAIGPFTIGSTNDLGDIVVSNGELYTITGTLKNCNGGNVSFGVASINIDNFHTVLPFTDGNGVFSISYIHCDPTLNILLQGFDAQLPLYSVPIAITISSGTTNVGSLVVCNQLDEFVILNIDGVTEIYNSNIGLALNQPDVMQITGQSLSGQGVADSVFVSFVFNNINGLNADLLNTDLMYWDASNNLRYAGCFFCSTCDCHLDVNPFTFTAFPNVVGDYATGTFSGKIKQDGLYVPFSIEFKARR